MATTATLKTTVTGAARAIRLGVTSVREAAPIIPQGSARPERSPLIPDGVMGMVLFVAIEMMMFAGLISAFMIVKGAAPGGVWPPPLQPRLPVEETLVNSLALLLSGGTLFWAERAFRKQASKAKWPLLISLLLGIFFVAAQGREWVDLLAQGLTIKSSTYGGFFYLIVGMHGLHAIAAAAGLIWAYVMLLLGKLKDTGFWTVQVFWYFVVGLWPILYWLVYL